VGLALTHTIDIISHQHSPAEMAIGLSLIIRLCQRRGVTRACACAPRLNSQAHWNSPACQFGWVWLRTRD